MAVVKGYVILAAALMAILFSSCSSIKRISYSPKDNFFWGNIQNGNSSSDVWLIPQASNLSLCRLSNGGIEKLEHVDLPYYSKYYITKDNYIVCLDTISQKIKIKQIKPGWQVGLNKEVIYPETIEPIAILKFKNMVFLGGIGPKGKIHLCIIVSKKMFGV